MPERTFAKRMACRASRGRDESSSCTFEYTPVPALRRRARSWTGSALRSLRLLEVARKMRVNPDIDIVKTEVLSDNWYVLRKVHYRMRKPDGTWAERTREAYDRGNGATILLY